MSEQHNFRTPLEVRRAAAINFSTLKLPELQFTPASLPDAAKTHLLAEEITAQFVPEAGKLAVMECLIDAQNWTIAYEHYSRKARKPSTIRSRLKPAPEGGFIFSINTDVPPSDLKAAALLAHNIGHSFLFDQTETPHKQIYPSTNAELVATEAFCSTLAFELTGVTE